jgi:hypothetical protein
MPRICERSVWRGPKRLSRQPHETGYSAAGRLTYRSGGVRHSRVCRGLTSLETVF